MTTKKRGSGERDLVKSPNADFYAKRDATGQFKDMDNVSRSNSTDQKRDAKHEAKPGRGDRGDRKS